MTKKSINLNNILTKYVFLSKIMITFASIMPATTTINRDDIVQQEILQAALRLYQKFGPNKVTMDDVANASGRSRTSLYYYYKNRDEIFQAVLDTIIFDIGEEIRRAIAAADTLNDKLYAFCITKLKTSEDWKSIFKAMWSTNEDDKQKHTKAMEALHKKLVHMESILVREIIATAIKQHDIKDISESEQDMMAFIISGSIRGIRSEINDHKDPHNIKAAIRLLTNMTAKWLEG